jgi:hypothetical protein
MGGVASFTPWPCNAWGERPRCPFNTRPGGPQSRAWLFGEEINLFLFRKSNYDYPNVQPLGPPGLSLFRILSCTRTPRTEQGIMLWNFSVYDNCMVWRQLIVCISRTSVFGISVCHVPNNNNSNNLLTANVLSPGGSGHIYSNGKFKSAMGTT